MRKLMDDVLYTVVCVIMTTLMFAFFALIWFQSILDWLTERRPDPNRFLYVWQTHPFCEGRCFAVIAPDVESANKKAIEVMDDKTRSGQTVVDRVWPVAPTGYDKALLKVSETFHSGGQNRESGN